MIQAMAACTITVQFGPDEAAAFPGQLDVGLPNNQGMLSSTITGAGVLSP